MSGLAAEEKYMYPRPLPVPAASPNKPQRIQDKQGTALPYRAVQLTSAEGKFVTFSETVRAGLLNKISVSISR